MPCALCPMPATLCPMPSELHPALYNLCPAPYTIPACPLPPVINARHVHALTHTRLHTFSCITLPPPLLCQGGLLSVVAKSIKVSLRPTHGMRVSSMRSGGRFNAAGMPVQRAPGGQGGEAFGIAFKPEAGAPGGSPRSEAAPTAALSVTFNDLYAGRCPLLAATATAMATHHCYCYCRSSCLLLTLTTTVLLH